MAISLADRIAGGVRGSVAAAMGFARRMEATDLAFLEEFFLELYRLCVMFAWDFALMAAQSAHETGNWAGKGFKGNTNWTVLHNPAGLAITNHENKSVVYRTGKDAARAFAVHMWIYLYGPLEPTDYLYQFRHLDGHYTEAATGTNRYRAGTPKPYAGSVRHLSDFQPNGQWALLIPYPAAGDRYGDRILAKARAMWPGLPDQGAIELPPTEPEEPVVTPVYGRVPQPPWIPMIVQKPEHNGSAYGYDRVAPRGKNKGVVHHETQGRGTIEWYKRFFEVDRRNDALVDFVIGRDGRIGLLNEFWGTRAPWANGGGVGSPGGLEGDGVAWVNRMGINAIGNALVSIEYEKTDAENFTPEQIVSGGWVAAYIHDQDGQSWETHPYTDKYGLVTSFAHFEFGTTNCGKGELDDISLVQAATKGRMKAAQIGGTDAPKDPDVPNLPDLPLPAGIPLKLAVERFDKITRHNLNGRKTQHGFDPRGVISMAWASESAKAFGDDYDKWPSGGDWYINPETETGHIDVITWKQSDLLMIRKSEKAGFRIV